MDVRIVRIQFEGLAILRDGGLEDALLVVGRTQVEPHAHVLRGQCDRFAILADGHVEPIQRVQGLSVKVVGDGIVGREPRAFFILPDRAFEVSDLRER